MSYKRGSIYLARLNPTRGTEPGKTRPCLVIQNDLLNSVEHPSTTILPMTSRLIEGAEPLRFDINARENLSQNSQVLIDQARTIDNRRFASEALTKLQEHEMAQLEVQLKVVLGLSP
ncbi:MAG TPA: type II toxin-antitoxin system PemK/MazF family toxin [Anaerolineales bacterium]|nr:type II toxin-antitoxin system PemK/MazF family toxin [Anaerolineales bacterium]